MDNRRNYYRVLRLQPEAPAALITRVYRSLMQQLRLHPDLGGDTWNAALINSAYRTLSRPHTRRQHDIELAARGLTPKIIGVGPLKAYLQHAATARRQNVNRRHYARVLQLQFDAEAALMTTARNWAIDAGATHKQAALIERAHALLVHHQTHARYAELLATSSHTDALAALQHEAAEREKSAAEARARHSANRDTTEPEEPSCPFCAMTPIRVSLTPEPVCSRCMSPLSAPPRVHTLQTNARRQIARVAKVGEVTIRVGWPPSHHRAYLVDASPTGVSFLSSSRLDGHRVVRVEGAGLFAVVELLHGDTGARVNRYGGRIVSATFDNQPGTFFHKTA